MIFCRCADGAFVIKGCATVAQEIYSAQMARVLGVAAPHTRLVSWPGSEWQNLQKNVKRHLLRKGLIDHSVANLKHKVEKELDRPHILIFELVPSAVGLDCLQPEELAELLGGAPGVREVGRVCGLDVLLNNADRLPLLWDNGGNAANFMLSSSPAGGAFSVFAIDQAAFSAPVGAARDQYCELQH